MIGVVDYEAGNIASVSNALSTIGVEFVVSNKCETLQSCHGIILPGVGAAPGAMSSLKSFGLDKFLLSVSKPLLGICLGMQLLYEESEEGPTRCLGVLHGRVKKFDERSSKVPHMGWNVVEQRAPNALMEGIPSREFFYFANSYFSPVDERTTAATSDGIEFSSIVQKGNLYGVQFHPEKSGRHGLALLNNFSKLCR